MPDGTAVPRGERNCNPGNIRKSDQVWKGQAETQDDPAFVVFRTPHFGIRALALTLLAYYRRHGLNTIRGIIHRWAPPQENATSAYVSDVAAKCRVVSDAPQKLDDPIMLCRLVTAIIAHENGRCVYTPTTIANAVDDALGREETPVT